MRLVGQVAVVTGGTRGLGMAIARGFLAEGASVVCAARRPHDVGKLAAEAPDRVLHQPTDVTDEQSVRDLMATAVRVFGGLDVLVCGAGTSRDGKVVRLSLPDWQETVATNLTGTFLCAKEAATHMVARGAGRIITVSSSLAGRVAVGAAAYSASKAAVEMFTRTAAAELGPKGINVNCLSPGYIDEGMGKRFSARPDLWEKHLSRLSLNRMGLAHEIADGALFLASAESSYINGHVLEVNGGLE
ncbi:SDR family NAD(P)-dependent oxidoreductase [Streptomyces tsukubensis]|uniref:3-oxoacyl-ACP reductase n=1 Tax=Streptomyces tsukubensis TaxID=83656 RepID=A0A1V4AFW4_9ACTN|nr:SDR family NAD(P)-dependent oxidoreductase [Streptomyces tsukubensis]OON82577.1 3-oxoacyl-ACP reductase [Streptomyces tsukubensis]QFR92259.1 SDR family oxidoreductase [Streptomyces tsukubensis]